MRNDNDLHIEEFKIRLKPADADLLRATARKLDIPPAVLLRRWAVRETSRIGYSLQGADENRRPV